MRSNLHWLLPLFPPSAITLVSASIQSHCHQALGGDEGLLIASRWGGWEAGGSQLNEYKSGDQPVTECWTAGFEDLTPFIIFACRILSQFTEPKGSGEAEWPLTLSVRGVWPEAEPTCLFTAYFTFVLYYYRPLDSMLTPDKFHSFIQLTDALCFLTVYCVHIYFTHRFDTVHV